MKKTTKILLMITFFLLLLAGCAEKINFEAQLAGNGIRKEAKKLHLFYMMMVHVKYLESTEQGHGVL